MKHGMLASAALLALSGFAPSHANPLVKPPQGGALIETGVATWYGGRHQGRRTSSGEIFDENAMTAAHASLPLGTRVRVTSAATGESVVVTINDREPPHGIRVIDLSRGAARVIGMSGISDVTISQVSPDEPDSAPVEVAEAGADPLPTSPLPHGRQHTHRAVRSVSAARSCCHARSATRARH